MYRVDGSCDLAEETLDHFEGYRGSSPVRIGNGAADQLQLDIYGEAMDSILFTDRAGLARRRPGLERHRPDDRLVVRALGPARRGDLGDTRGVASRSPTAACMEWVAFDRAIRMAIDHGRPADLERWRTERDEIYRWVQTKGWNDSMKAFVQYEGSDVLDASLLLMPLIGFVSPFDEKWQSTLTAMDKVLVSDSLVYRYDPKASPDGLAGIRRHVLAVHLLSTSTPLRGRAASTRRGWCSRRCSRTPTTSGLFAEEIGLTGEQLGNFPQAFTHLALINAALNLNYQLDHGAGRVNVVDA